MSKAEKCLCNRGTYTHFTYRVGHSKYSGSYHWVRPVSVACIMRRLKRTWGKDFPDAKIGDVVITGSSPSGYRVFADDN